MPESNTILAFFALKSISYNLVAKLRGKKSEEIAPPGLVQAFERTKAEKKVKALDES